LTSICIQSLLTPNVSTIVRELDPTGRELGPTGRELGPTGQELFFKSYISRAFTFCSKVKILQDL